MKGQDLEADVAEALGSWAAGLVNLPAYGADCDDITNTEIVGYNHC